MKWYPWLRSHFERLITNYQTGRGHHALLVQAPPGMGADVLIYAITRFLLCKNPGKYKVCRKCRSCQLMQAGTHPDYHTLKPLIGLKLGIDVIRNVSKKLYEHSCLGGAKVVSINDATLLTEAATNALLKTLEEPPLNTWFFFSCYESRRLLSTLCSRFCLYYLTVPQEELALVWLQKEIIVSLDTALTALRLCGGAPAAALKLLQENHWTLRSYLCLSLDNVLKSRDWLSLLMILNHEHAATYLSWLVSLLLDALKVLQGAIIITNIDVLPMINKIARALPGAVLYSIIHTLCQCREQLLTIACLNRELVLTDKLLLIELHLLLGTTVPISYF